jgi:hypothetical protein
MTPDTRWLLAAALAVSAVIWTVFCWHRPPDHFHQKLSLSLSHADDQPRLTRDAAVDAEARWIGHDPVVKHHPDEGRSHFFAELDADETWERDSAHDGASPDPPAARGAPEGR